MAEHKKQMNKETVQQQLSHQRQRVADHRKQMDEETQQHQLPEQRL